jgi:hypothetical protein
MVAVAELEAGMISARTKAALVAAKKRGKKLGGRRRKVIGKDAKNKPIYGEVANGSAKARANGRAALQHRADARASEEDSARRSKACRRPAQRAYGPSLPASMRRAFRRRAATVRGPPSRWRVYWRGSHDRALQASLSQP